MYNVAAQIDDWETRAWCPFCSYVLSEACRIRKWLIHYSLYTAYRDVRQIYWAPEISIWERITYHWHCLIKQYKTEQPAIDGHSLLFSARCEKNNSTSDLQSGPSCGIVGKKHQSGNTPWWLLHHDLLWTTCCHRNTKGFLTQQLLPLQDLFQAP